MGRFGDAFGIPFAIEGLFFFLEAIFLAIYIYGWKRLKPWPHFWTGVPIVIAGIGGTVSVVAANAWMNEPAGLHVELGGQGRRRRPVGVIFNKAMPLQSLHMLIAAYLVGGFLVASVYAVRDAARAARPLPPASASSSRSPSPRSRCRSRCSSATSSRAGSTTTNRSKFAAIEMVPKTVDRRARDAVRPPQRQGRGAVGGIAIPGLASILSDPADGTSTRIQGLDSFPKDERPTNARGQRGAPRVGRDGRARHAAVPALALVLRGVGVQAAHARRASSSSGSPRPPACCR